MDLLTSEEERRLYDWSLLRKATHSVDYAWPFEADISQRLPDSPPLSVSQSLSPVNCQAYYAILKDCHASSAHSVSILAFLLSMCLLLPPS